MSRIKTLIKFSDKLDDLAKSLNNLEKQKENKMNKWTRQESEEKKHTVKMFKEIRDMYQDRDNGQVIHVDFKNKIRVEPKKPRKKVA